MPAWAMRTRWGGCNEGHQKSFWSNSIAEGLPCLGTFERYTDSKRTEGVPSALDQTIIYPNTILGIECRASIAASSTTSARQTLERLYSDFTTRNSTFLRTKQGSYSVAQVCYSSPCSSQRDCVIMLGARLRKPSAGTFRLGHASVYDVYSTLLV